LKKQSKKKEKGKLSTRIGKNVCRIFFGFFLMISIPATIIAPPEGIPLLLISIVSLFGFELSFKKDERKYIEEVHKKENSEIPLEVVEKLHFSGLPIPENMRCQIQVFVNRIEIIAGKQTFSIPMERICGAEISFKLDQTYKIKTSLGKAAIGGMVLGPVGAIVMGGPQSKKDYKSQNYLIISYINTNQENAYLVFDGEFTQKICKAIQNNAKGNPAVVEI
jgi:hypothetical protein